MCVFGVECTVCCVVFILISMSQDDLYLFCRGPFFKKKKKDKNRPNSITSVWMRSWMHSLRDCSSGYISVLHSLYTVVYLKSSAFGFHTTPKKQAVNDKERLKQDCYKNKLSVLF